MRLLLLCLAAIGACNGNTGSAPAVTPGNGILVTGGQISVDPSKVPIVSACAADQLVQQQADGTWHCVAAKALKPDNAAHADDSAKVGGHDPSEFMPAGGTAADSSKLAGQTKAQLDAHWAIVSPTAPQAGTLNLTGDISTGGKLHGDGSLLSSLNATNLGSGTVSDARLSGNVPLLSANNTFAGAQGFNDVVVSGTLVAALDAGALIGAISDTHLSANVCRLGSNNTFSGTQAFGNLTVSGTLNAALDASHLTGSIDDTRLSNHVALTTASNTWTGTQSFQSLTGNGAGLTGVKSAGVQSGAADPPCDSASKGALYFNTSDNTFRGCNGTSFTLIGGGAGPGLNPGIGPTRAFTYSGGAQTFTVPAGVTSVDVKLWGAGGAGVSGTGGSVSASGGAGGYAAGTIDVSPGDVLTILVGGGGFSSGGGGFGGGGNGGTTGGVRSGGGGGFTAIRAGTADLLIAGGGGGASNHGAGSSGGNGGGVNGGIGANGNAFTGTLAGGGTQTAGGAGAANDSGSGGAGAPYQGGDGILTSGAKGGGGGGGRFGGGGGTGSGPGANWASSGAGGSGFAAASGVANAVILGSASPNPLTANVVPPPHAGDPDYLSGAGVGGAFGDGGPGLVVFRWAGQVPQPPSLGANSATGKQVFSSVGHDQSFQVPAGVSALHVKAWGAGGGGFSLVGGPGGFTDALVAVTPGEILTVVVGSASAPGGNGYGGGGLGGSSSCVGGNGGGRTALRRAGTELLTAGGGGGADNHGSGSTGGAGGGLTGGAGTSSYVNNYTGAGGTQTSGGTGGSNQYQQGQTGSQFTGGSGANVSGCFGGGGGGGWFGGGGGATTASGPNYATGGGGGSGYVGGPGVFGTSASSASPTPLGLSIADPPATSDPDYVAPAGRSTTNDGKDGLLVVLW